VAAIHPRKKKMKKGTPDARTCLGEVMPYPDSPLLNEKPFLVKWITGVGEGW
jgi:hypothetical protein